jgi:antitoxin (DNA-binding transcriptional repressor) of toxin-antitoxin stability system
MYHMKKASIRDLRYRFPQVEDLLRQGHEISITKRKKVIAHLIPNRPAAAERPDFLGRLKKLYGEKRLAVSGADLLAKERDRY